MSGEESIWKNNFGESLLTTDRKKEVSAEKKNLKEKELYMGLSLLE